MRGFFSVSTSRSLVEYEKNGGCPRVFSKTPSSTSTRPSMSCSSVDYGHGCWPIRGTASPSRHPTRSGSPKAYVERVTSTARARSEHCWTISRHLTHLHRIEIRPSWRCCIRRCGDRRLEIGRWITPSVGSWTTHRSLKTFSRYWSID